MRAFLVATLALATATATAAAGCKKESPEAKPAPTATAPATSGVPGVDGVRRVPVEAGKDGYVPGRIEGKACVKLTLVFTRTVDGDCLAKVKVADEAPVDLPKGQAVEVAVTVPASGELRFAFGMGMFTGVIVPGA